MDLDYLAAIYLYGFILLNSLSLIFTVGVFLRSRKNEAERKRAAQIIFKDILYLVILGILLGLFRSGIIGGWAVLALSFMCFLPFVVLIFIKNNQRKTGVKEL